MTLLDPQFPLVGTVHTGAITRPLLDSVSWPRVGKAVAVESRSFCTFEPPYSKTQPSRRRRKLSSPLLMLEIP